MQASLDGVQAAICERPMVLLLTAHRIIGAFIAKTPPWNCKRLSHRLL